MSSVLGQPGLSTWWKTSCGSPGVGVGVEHEPTGRETWHPAGHSRKAAPNGLAPHFANFS